VSGDVDGGGGGAWDAAAESDSGPAPLLAKAAAPCALWPSRVVDEFSAALPADMERPRVAQRTPLPRPRAHGAALVDAMR